ncbi:MAG: exonuclease SbcCD subunit D [Ruminococcaceae bacterium]|nr:exonuclease SbcCD subunit D [Oscillospiraceae bacterium]
MKLLHISDLHIGKRLCELSLLEDQAYILNQIIEIAEQEKPDAALIAGDLYDKSTPPAEAVRLCDDFLCRLAEVCPVTAIISGNHDSAERVSFGGRLMNSRGVYISPVYNGSVSPITLSDAHGEADIFLLPFIKPVHVRAAFPDEEISSYTDALRVAVEHLPIDHSRRSILVTHQYVTGASRSESEEMSVGGSDNVDAAVFAPFDYVALGHLHMPQNVGSDAVRYCGSPLKYSFSEAKGEKSVTIVDVEAKGTLALREIPLKPLRDMVQLRGDFAQLSDRVPGNPESDPFTRITLTDENDIPDAFNRLRLVYPNLLRLDYDNTRTRSGGVVEINEQAQSKSPDELLDELFVQQCGQPMSGQQRDLAMKLISEIWEGEK